MPVSGYLSNFSLPEVLQFVQEGNKTGLLTVRSLPDSTDEFRRYFIWLNQGRIVAAADRTDYRGLFNMILTRKWIPEEELHRSLQDCPLRMPFGLHLKSQSLLSAEQMKLLFSIQIIRQICALFELVDGSFHFTSNVQLPYFEMTGINIPATEVTLPGLRNLTNWSALESKLPQLTSGLLGMVEGELPIALNAKESKVWGFANGMVAIGDIAKQLDLSVELTRQTAFCLTVAGLAEEVPMLSASSKADVQENDEPLRNAPSSAFLEKMMGFLKQKAELQSAQGR
jgi:Domain of unknown function (DUF4388)